MLMQLCVLFVGESECSPEQSRPFNLSDENGQVSDGQSHVVLGEICEFVAGNVSVHRYLVLKYFVVQCAFCLFTSVVRHFNN